MMNFLVRNIVPYKKILKYFFQRYLGKFLEIDLDKADWKGDEISF